LQNEEVRKIAALYKTLSIYYGQNISDEVISLYAHHLADEPFDAVYAALRELNREKNRRTLPLPADVFAKLNPENTSLESARIAANNIIAAIPKFGHTNPTRAKEFIGDLGWLVVERMGGWHLVCQESDVSTIQIRLAQMRDLAESLHQQSKNGTLKLRPSLPSRQQETISKIAATAFKEIE
jgi:hypothetical protein